MLCIRISEQEYEDLKVACKAAGARSISDLAREAVSRLIGFPGESDPPELARRVDEIDVKVESLKNDLRRLQQLLEANPNSRNLTQDQLLQALEAASGR